MKKTLPATYLLLLFLAVSCIFSDPNKAKESYKDNDEDFDPPYTNENEQDPDTGNDDGDKEKTNEESDEPEKECSGLSMPFTLFEKTMRTEPDYFEHVTFIGDPYGNDSLEIYFRNENDIERKHYLGIGDNADEGTCNACISLTVDAYAGGFYFQKSGYITVDYLDPVNYGIKGSMSVQLEKKFADAYIGYEQETEECYEIEGAFDITCEPECKNKVCGSDGCGRTCGECGGNEYCSNDQSKCIPYDCEELSFGELKLENWDYTAYAKDNAAGDPSFPDRLTMNFDRFYQIPVGTFDLTSEDGGYSSGFAIFLCEDAGFDGSESSCGKSYRPRRGTLTVSESSGRRETVGNAAFTLSEHWGGMMPHFADNGKCYEVSLNWDTFCKPDCTGRICGNDGCGGSCGDCESGKMCNTEQTGCVDRQCLKIDSLSVYHAFLNSNALSKEYIYKPNTGSDEENLTDRFILSIVKVSELKYNQDYKLPVKEENGLSIDIKIEEDYGCHPDQEGFCDYHYDKLYTITGGTISFEALDSKTSPYPIKAIMKDLHFVEAEKGNDNTYIPVAGGDCIEFSSGKFNNF